MTTSSERRSRGMCRAVYASADERLRGRRDERAHRRGWWCARHARAGAGGARRRARRARGVGLRCIFDARDGDRCGACIYAFGVGAGVGGSRQRSRKAADVRFAWAASAPLAGHGAEASAIGWLFGPGVRHSQLMGTPWAGIATRVGGPAGARRRRAAVRALYSGELPYVTAHAAIARSPSRRRRTTGTRAAVPRVITLYIRT